MNEHTVASPTERSRECNALVLPSTKESVLRAGRRGTDIIEVQEIPSGRVVADALIPERDGTMRRVLSEVGGIRKRAAQVLEISLRRWQYRIKGYPVRGCTVCATCAYSALRR